MSPRLRIISRCNWHHKLLIWQCGPLSGDAYNLRLHWMSKLAFGSISSQWFYKSTIKCAIWSLAPCCSSFFPTLLGGFLCRDPLTDCKVGDCPVEWVRAVQVHPLVVLWAEYDKVKLQESHIRWQKYSFYLLSWLMRTVGVLAPVNGDAVFQTVAIVRLPLNPVGVPKRLATENIRSTLFFRINV